MVKLIDLVREHRRRRARINNKVALVQWPDFDEGRPCEAPGLQQAADASFQHFKNRVVGVARAEGSRVHALRT
jgi:hypothetical protein